MKNIDNFTLDNMVQIERYIQNKMSKEEQQEFLQRLSIDEELQHDYEIAKDILLIENSGKKRGFAELEHLKFYDNGDFKVSRKGKIGKELIGNGLMAVFAVVFMILTCVLILTIIA